MSTESHSSDSTASPDEQPDKALARRTVLTGLLVTTCVGVLHPQATAATQSSGDTRVQVPPTTLRIRPTRLSMKIDTAANSQNRGAALPLYIRTTSPQTTNVTVKSSTGRVTVGSTQKATDQANSMTVPVAPNAEAVVWVTPREVGKPAEPGDLITISDGRSQVQIEAWIEPTGGRWEPLSRPGERAKLDLEIVAVHAALMRGPKGPEVIMYSPPRERDEKGNLRERPGVDPEKQEKWIWDVMDFENAESRTLNLKALTTQGVNSGDMQNNIFCSGASHLPDGRLLVVGGHFHMDHETEPGELLHLYDPRSSSWAEVKGFKLEVPRWYPTVTPLPDGLMLIAGGYKDGNWGPQYFERAVNDYILYDPAGNKAERSGELVDHRKLTKTSPLAAYPGIFVLPGSGDSDTVIAVVETNRAWLNIYQPGQKLTPAGGPRMMHTGGSRSYPWYGSMVLLPLHPGDRKARILAVGGSHEKNHTDHTKVDLKHGKWPPATATADLLRLDLTKPLANPESATWTKLDALCPRFMCDATLMADGTVLISGGAKEGWTDHNHGPVNQAVIFDPKGETFRLAATAATERRYHSVALLLPDGTVLKAGSTGGFGGPNVDEGKNNKWFLSRTDAERYLPPYLWRGPRPTIKSVNATLAPKVGQTLYHGKDFTIHAEGSSLDDKCKVALIRLGATTHGNDMEQRYVWLSVSRRSRTGDRWIITAAPHRNKAATPPGDYMLVVVDSLGVPSTAELVRVANKTT
jgi:hypothetical protein